MWSDIFYPDNPKRRRKVVQLLTEILTLMENNFKSTNYLINLIHEYLPGKKFQHITVNHDGTINENCLVFITRINDIQTYLIDKNKKMKKEIDPTIYKQIMDTKVKFTKKIVLLRKINSAGLATIGTVVGLAVTASISTGTLLASMVARLSLFTVLTVANVVIGIVFIGIDMIASAIMGAVERDKLERSIKELKYAMKLYKPASHDYDRDIIKMAEKIKLLAELGLA